MALTDEDVAELLSMTLATPASKERILAHMDMPICVILKGLKIHIKAIGYVEAWRLCYALKCHSMEELEKTMWSIIQKRQRKDSGWDRYLLPKAKLQ